MIQKIIRWPLISFILRSIHSNFSYCDKCGLPWCYCEPRSVMTDAYTGTFAVCKYCWDRTSLEGLQYHYRRVWQRQKADGIRYGYEMKHTLKHYLPQSTRVRFRNILIRQQVYIMEAYHIME